MNVEQHGGERHAEKDPLDVFVSLREASQAYDISVAALRSRIGFGELRAYKVAGRNGHEWRVSLRSLKAAGYAPRLPAQTSRSDSARVRELEAELAAVRRRAAAEQRRADRADQELGYALLELGRLRSSTSLPVDRT